MSTVLSDLFCNYRIFLDKNNRCHFLISFFFPPDIYLKTYIPAI